jgi:hypothetical protein
VSGAAYSPERWTVRGPEKTGEPDPDVGIFSETWEAMASTGGEPHHDAFSITASTEELARIAALAPQMLDFIEMVRDASRDALVDGITEEWALETAKRCDVMLDAARAEVKS